MARFLPGLELARRFYAQAVRPILQDEFPRLSYDAALIGAGSDVLGYDTPRSTDHDWGPRLQMFLGKSDHRKVARRVKVTLSRRLLPTFLGYSTHWSGSDDAGEKTLVPYSSGFVRHRVQIFTTREYFRGYLGVDPTRRLAVRDWLGMSSQLMLGATSGRVFHAGLGALDRIRRTLRWYPDPIWRYLLACQWNKIGQTEPFVGRTGEVGDDLGSRLVATGLVRDLMRLAFLMERTYAPYQKWFGTGFMKLRIARRLGPTLHGVMTAATWRGRERHLSRAYAICVAAHNRLGITKSRSGRVTKFWDRPFLIIHADRIAEEIRRSIRDSQVRAIRSMAGNIDQISDATDVADFPELAHRIAGTIR